MQATVQDHVAVYQTPAALDCTKWSQDNLLAVAVGSTITIYSPAALGGPRAYISYRVGDARGNTLGFRPADWQDCAQFSLEVVSRVAAPNEPAWSGIAWSPMGCTPSGGCLLAALSSDNKVRGEPTSLSWADPFSPVSSYPACIKDRHAQPAQFQAIQVAKSVVHTSNRWYYRHMHIYVTPAQRALCPRCGLWALPSPTWPARGQCRPT